MLVTFVLLVPVTITGGSRTHPSLFEFKDTPFFCPVLRSLPFKSVGVIKSQVREV